MKYINKYYIKVSIITFLMLFVVMLAFYPGLVPYDGNNQWQQVQSGIYTNGHPFFSTFFLFLLSKIWNKVTIVIIYQIIIFSVSWGYLCKNLKLSNKKQNIIIYIATTCMLLYPLFSIYSITMWKDILYTYYLFLCSIILYKWVTNNYRLKSFEYCLLGLLMAMVFSYRYNGIIVIFFMLLIFYILSIKKYIKRIINKEILKKSLLLVITFIIIITIISIPKKIILEKSHQELIKDSNYVEPYSTLDGYFLWMMGAHIKNNNINNKNDKEFLNNIIPLKEWKENYSPYIINLVHDSKNLDKNFLRENSQKFRKIFIKYSLKYPITILKHYYKADALLFNPVSSLDGHVYVYCFPEIELLPDYTQIKSKIPFVKAFYSTLLKISFYKPFIIFYEPAFVLYISLIITYLLSKKVYGKKIWIFTIPMILNTISLLPINLAQDLRYVYINYLTFAGLILMFILNIKVIMRKKNDINYIKN